MNKQRKEEYKHLSLTLTPVLVPVEGEAQAALHRAAAVGAVVDAAAEPLPLGSVQAGVAVVDPAGQVSGHAGPVEVLCDLTLADSLTVVTQVVVELLQDRVHLEAKRRTDGSVIVSEPRVILQRFVLLAATLAYLYFKQHRPPLCCAAL